MIRVLSVDDHPLLRDGIAALIGNQTDMELVAEACNGLEALEQFRRHHPDITLMDLQMPKMSGIDAISAIRGEFPDRHSGNEFSSAEETVRRSVTGLSSPMV